MEGYATPPRTWSPARSAALMTVVVVLSFTVGVLSAPYLNLPYRAARAATPTPSPNLETLTQAWAIVEKNFVYRDSVDEVRMRQVAIRGMIAALGDDGHTRYLSPREVTIERSGLAGRLEGIGIEVSQRNGRYVVVAPIEGSPAERAGIRAGDIIAAVEGVDADTLTMSDLSTKIRGPKGTTVRISVIHQSERTPVELTITREEIALRAVTWARVPDTTIALIRITQFSERATRELREAIVAARAGGADRLVVDVRNNPGGYLDQAIGVTSQFIDGGHVLIEENASGDRKYYDARPEGAARDLPLVLLINRGSASSSEVLAGALQDRGRAPIVGETTFGTGTILSTFRLKDESEILLGTAQWLTPTGRKIRKVGIKPDIWVVAPTNGQPLSPREVAQRPLAEIATADPQLARALHELDSRVALAP